jgi:transcriptional regulator with XRE-family HTH domain
LATSRRRRGELAAFLRGRRARVAPGDVGIPPGFRRRTPGLRREEVALLSGVGVTWYTWLEQGRPINVSAQVLDAVAETLKLDTAERAHLFHLAEVAHDPDPRKDAVTVPPEVQGIIDALDAHPAVVYSAQYDILATNAAYRDYVDLDLIREAGLSNVLWIMLTMDPANCPLADREADLAMMVATLRNAYGRHVGERDWELFIRRLISASAEFTELWQRGDVAPPKPQVRRFRHKAVGEVRLATVSMSVNGMPECQIVIHTPDDEVSRQRSEVVRTLRG